VPAWGTGDGVTDPARDYGGRPGAGFARVLASAKGESPVFYLRAVGAGDAPAADADSRLRPGGSWSGRFDFSLPAGHSATVRARIIHRLRFKAQWDRYLAANAGVDPASLETAGDDLTLTAP
jgi:hypothetical protein